MNKITRLAPLIGIVFIALFGLNSCYINSDLMLKTHREYVFNEPDSVQKDQYLLQANDLIQFRLFANNGYKIIELTSGAEAETGAGGVRGGMMVLQENTINYFIQPNGYVRVPLLDTVNITGLNIRQAEDSLASMYARYYIDPFVQIKVVNRRIIVFPGNGGDARVIPLTNNNMTLVEGLAQAGGVANRGRAAKIKLIRQEEGKQKVFLIDLSTIEGLKYTGLILQANDIIYVEPRPELAREVLRDVAPIVSLVSSALFIYYTVAQFNK
ncbi:MAG: polysaccharide biosynthesis/export family protein [Flavobacteriales bacterium]